MNDQQADDTDETLDNQSDFQPGDATEDEVQGNQTTSEEAPETEDLGDNVADDSADQQQQVDDNIDDLNDLAGNDTDNQALVD